MHSIKITIHVFVGFNRSFVYYLYAGVIQVQCIRLTLITLHRIITKGLSFCVWTVCGKYGPTILANHDTARDLCSPRLKIGHYRLVTEHYIE
jgi:hypothetical protein